MVGVTSQPAMGVITHPLAGSQLAVWQGSGAWQASGAPEHDPFWQEYV
jgi:hypothetical protein